jgi:raffinose/stachyose/melibiose transport system permease protein
LIKEKKPKDLTFIIFYIILLIWTILTIYPLIFTIISSLKSERDMFSNMLGLPENIIINNYIDLFTKIKIQINIFNSLFITSSCVVVQMLIATMAAFVLVYSSIKFKNSIFLFFILGILIPIQSMLIPLAVIAKLVNGYNSYLFIISLYITLGLSYVIFVLTGFIRGIPLELIESALIDGSSMNKTFWTIVLPLTKPAVATMGLLSFIGAWNDLILALIFIKKSSMKTISLALAMFAGDRFSNFPGMCAAVIVGILPTLLIYFFFQENIIKGMTAGAIKG